MSKKIKLAYTWDKETFLQASKAIYDFNMKHSPKRFLGWFFIALTQFGVVGALKKDVYGLLIISTLLVIYWYALRWPLRKNMLLRGFMASDIKNHKFSIEIDENNLKIDGSFIEWREILEVISLCDGYLLYKGDSFLFFPKSTFKSTEDREKFIVLVKKKEIFYKKEC
ncbi:MULTISPECIES: hypothetical protein [Sulfurimonas]|uniref:YcxB family protein n=1 Tax=Sulfurimonas TaxID=202746 RepID=UPI0012640481|nr:hypothetical protein [Sulfurimonas indica]